MTTMPCPAFNGERFLSDRPHGPQTVPFSCDAFDYFLSLLLSDLNTVTFHRYLSELSSRFRFGGVDT